MPKQLSAVLVLSALFATPLSAADLPLFEQTERHMGTTVTIKLYAKNEAIANQGFTAAFQRIAELDRVMSDYNETSELSRLSAAAPTSASVPLGNDLYRVLQAAQDMSVASDGAFDITVGPLTKLWRRSRRQKELPSPERMAEARAAVGYTALRLHDQPPSAELLRPHMRLDLGGIGQGFAADEALIVLKKMGLPRVSIDVSGDIVFGDPPPGEPGWKTGIAPLDANAPPSTILFLSNCAISTSGDAFQFVEIGGVRYSHIVDPQTGLGLTTRISVTILAKDCTTADALATAVCVLGPQRGLQLVETRPDTSALFVFQEQGKTQTIRSTRFPEKQSETKK